MWIYQDHQDYGSQVNGELFAKIFFKREKRWNWDFNLSRSKSTLKNSAFLNTAYVVPTEHLYASTSSDLAYGTGSTPCWRKALAPWHRSMFQQVSTFNLPPTKERLQIVTETIGVTLLPLGTWICLKNKVHYTYTGSSSSAQLTCHFGDGVSTWLEQW